ncbi:MAG: aminotransferase class V-fold PLP-dependent enzyme, partial [Clostridia bacterium]|nr:aminotransferase class V-fold PLP-dependent enzyme [Clostridia bacterium]
GSGALLFDENTDISPLTYGGTGTDSFNPVQPDVYPEKLEAGTLNLPAIAALNEGVNFISKNITNFNEQMIAVTEKLILALEELDGITVYSQPNPSGIVSFLTKHTDSTEVADILNKKYDIAVRGGFHCAPLMHKYLGTENSGLVRVSLAIQNSSSELSYFIRALKEICKG